MDIEQLGIILEQIETKKSFEGKTSELLPLDTVERQRNELYTTLSQAIQNQEQNLSIVLEGGSGTGKTTILTDCFNKIREKDIDFHVVWLNGYVQTTDKCALDEVIRQLSLVSVELQKLQDTEEQEGEDFARDDYIRSVLQQGKRVQNPIIFVLDDFDEFACRAKQSLLYYLLDLQQMKEVQICIIGTTVRTDAFSLLEKRVRSRFNDFKIRFPSSVGNSDKIKMMFDRLLSFSKPRNAIQKSYNRSVKSSLQHDLVLEQFQAISYSSQCTPQRINQMLICAACQVDPEIGLLTPDILLYAIENQIGGRSPYELLQDLCITELVIICAMVRLKLLKKVKKYNFVQIVEEIYSSKLLKKNHNFNDEVIGEMLERLLKMRLVLYFPRQNNILQRYKKMRLSINAAQAKEFICKKLGNQLPHWVVKYVKVCGE